MCSCYCSKAFIQKPCYIYTFSNEYLVYYSVFILFYSSFSVNESSVHDSVSAAIKVLRELRCIEWPHTDESQLAEMATFYERTGK